jgi:hypothetical protein
MKISNLQASTLQLQPIFKLDPHKLRTQQRNENLLPLLPNPYSLLPIFSLGTMSCRSQRTDENHSPLTPDS